MIPFFLGSEPESVVPNLESIPGLNTSISQNKVLIFQQGNNPTVIKWRFGIGIVSNPVWAASTVIDLFRWCSIVVLHNTMCMYVYLCGPTANFAHSPIGVDADVVDAESAVGVHAVLRALARGAGALERRDHAELGEPVAQVLQTHSLMWEGRALCVAALT